ncbi:MAG: DMT family transporter [Chloroflexi bacterium]|nr:DMT family transporter [Chloroflexota bacterium]
MSPMLLEALGAMVLAGVSDTLYKRAQLHGTRPASFFVMQAVVFLPACLLIALLTGTLVLTPAALQLGVPAGLFLFGGQVLFLRSLQHGDATINVPIYKLSFVVTATVAVLLFGERLTVVRILAIGLAVVGVLVLAGGESARSHRLDRQGLGLLLLATVFFGLFQACYKGGMLAGAPPYTFLTVQAATFLVLAAAASYREDRLHPTWAAVLHAPICGALLTAGYGLLLLSLQQGDATISIPIAQLSFVVTSLLAVLVLGEQMTGRKVAGTLAAVLAIALFSLESR